MSVVEATEFVVLCHGNSGKWKQCYPLRPHDKPAKGGMTIHTLGTEESRLGWIR